MGQTIAEEIYEEGWTKGRSEGLSEGQLKNSRQVLGQLLMRRFSVVPEALLQRIEATTNVDRLNAAALQVADLATPEDLQL